MVLVTYMAKEPIVKSDITWLFAGSVLSDVPEIYGNTHFTFYIFENLWYAR